jgi:16S rRNA (cytosine967-C5)-methyltransferase
MPSSARLLSVDISWRRLSRLRENLARRGLEGRMSILLADGRAAPLQAQSADVVLLDAPCTGTGVLARRHDARWRREPEDLIRMARLQRALLVAAIDLLRPGGTVVYATCSLEAEENDEVVDSVLRLRDDVEEIGVPVSVAHELRCGKRLQCWPHRHGTDGAFAARLRRREAGT